MINGVINIYKPQNVTSNHVVIKIKKMLGIKKVGHTGTLDPLACGVLPICIGNATKISEYLLNKDKVYRVTLKFGILTDTYDCEGEVLDRDENFVLDENELLNTLSKFVGEQDQVPPNYSALKVQGRRAYELAREGVQFELSPRKITIHFIEDITLNKEDNECSFTVKCSKGTYIRSLCRDIAESLGTFGTMVFLERIESGRFTKEGSLDFNEMDVQKIQDKVMPIDEVMSLPKIEINHPNIIKLLTNGVCVKNPRYISGINEGLYLLYKEDGLIGICERKSDFLKVIKFLN